MKYSFLLLVLIVFQGQSQSYTIIHTIGKIYDTKSGTYLSKGTKISEDANLKFETADAKAAVLSSSKGRFVIQQNSTSTSQGDAVYALASVISPVRGRLSTRTGSINNALDFKKHFEEGALVLLGDSYSVSVSPAAFPMNESKFFYVQYEIDNETVNKKLRSKNENLVFDLTEFYSIDGQAIDPELIRNPKLFYYNAEEQASAFITKMSLVYLSNKELKSLVEQFPNDDIAILEIIHSMYGKCSEEQLEKALANL